MAKTKAAETVLATEVRQLQFVNDESTYFITLQMGAAKRWREFAAGRWVADLTKPAVDGERHHTHVPAIYERVGPFSGQVTNGLISEHNMWREKNAARVKGGEIQFQMLVLNTEETTEEAIDSANKGLRLEHMIERIVTKTVTAIFEKFMDAKK